MYFKNAFTLAFLLTLANSISWITTASTMRLQVQIIERGGDWLGWGKGNTSNIFCYRIISFFFSILYTLTEVSGELAG